MPVEIVGDPAQLLKPTEFECVVAAVKDYVPAVQRIKKAVAAKEPLRVLVRDDACAVWLERLAASYSDVVVHYSKETARDLLAERWQLELPEHVTDEAILASGFLEADIVPRSGQSYDEVVLEHYWGEFFTFVRFPLPLAGELIDSLEPERWRVNQQWPLATQALWACQGRWLSQARGRERDLVRAVFEAPAALKDYLGRYKLLQGYPPKLGQTVLGQWYMRFKNLEIDPTPADLESLDLGDAVQQIRYYLNGLAACITSQIDLEAVLDEMSGWLPDEFEWVVEQLQDKGDALRLTPELFGRIRDRFRPIQNQVESQLATLENTIPPAYPQDPPNNRIVQDWLDWAISSYLPYRFWLEENNRWDETIAGYAASYADWFYENYVTHKYQYQTRWVSSLLNRALVSLKAGRKVLFIVIDNWNYKYLEPLLMRFGQRGFRLVEEVEPVWSPIPTATEVSKWCLIAGEPELGQVRGHNYEDILDKDWRGHFGGYKVTYLPRLGDLKRRRGFSEDLILLNYLPVDDVLHKDERQIAATHTAEIQGYLETLAQEVIRFAKQARVEQELDIFIASDHGSTKIPTTVGNIVDESFHRERAKDRHHRYIVVPKGRATNPTAYDQAHCYVVCSDALGTRENYFIARGYGRFIETKESIYMHGGLTPEETIVPFCRLAKTEIEALQPTIYLPDNVVRYSVKADLVFNIGNPNDYEIRNVELNILESDLPGMSVEAVPAGISAEVAFPVRIKRQPGVPSLENITVEGSFELQGQRFPIRAVQIAVQARSLVESKTEFDFGVWSGGMST